jgi:hypothetical protein
MRCWAGQLNGVAVTPTMKAPLSKADNTSRTVNAQVRDSFPPPPLRCPRLPGPSWATIGAYVVSSPCDGTARGGEVNRRPHPR